MSWIKQCDRCGRNIDGELESSVNFTIRRPKLQTESTVKDLCKICTEYFEKLLKKEFGGN